MPDLETRVTARETAERELAATHSGTVTGTYLKISERRRYKAKTGEKAEFTRQ